MKRASAPEVAAPNNNNNAATKDDETSSLASSELPQEASLSFSLPRDASIRTTATTATSVAGGGASAGGGGIRSRPSSAEMLAASAVGETMGVPPEHIQDGYFSPELSKFLDSQAEKIMDITVGRYAVIQQDPKCVNEYLKMAVEDVRAILRGTAKKARKEVLSQNQFDLEAAIRRLSRDLIHEKEEAAILAKKTAVIVEEARRANAQLSLVQGQVVRRDKLLNDQRLAFLKELSMLKESLWQMKTRGQTDVPDAQYYNWNDDPLAEELLRDEKLRLEKLLDDMREKYEREKDMIDHTRQREIEDLKKLLVANEARKASALSVAVQTEISAFHIDPHNLPPPSNVAALAAVSVMPEEIDGGGEGEGADDDENEENEDESEDDDEEGEEEGDEEGSSPPHSQRHSSRKNRKKRGSHADSVDFSDADSSRRPSSAGRSSYRFPASPSSTRLGSASGATLETKPPLMNSSSRLSLTMKPVAPSASQESEEGWKGSSARSTASKKGEKGTNQIHAIIKGASSTTLISGRQSGRPHSATSKDRKKQTEHSEHPTTDEPTQPSSRATTTAIPIPSSDLIPEETEEAAMERGISMVVPPALSSARSDVVGAGGSGHDWAFVTDDQINTFLQTLERKPILKRFLQTLEASGSLPEMRCWQLGFLYDSRTFTPPGDDAKNKPQEDTAPTIRIKLSSAVLRSLVGAYEAVVDGLGLQLVQKHEMAQKMAADIRQMRRLLEELRDASTKGGLNSPSGSLANMLGGGTNPLEASEEDVITTTIQVVRSELNNLRKETEHLKSQLHEKEDFVRTQLDVISNLPPPRPAPSSSPHVQPPPHPISFRTPSTSRQPTPTYHSQPSPLPPAATPTVGDHPPHPLLGAGASVAALSAGASLLLPPEEGMEGMQPDATSEEALMRTQALVTKLVRELEFKDQVLSDKRAEIDRITDEIEGWFERHGGSGSAGGAMTPFVRHFDMIGDLRVAFERAEQAESNYRVSGWAVLALSAMTHQMERDMAQIVVSGDMEYDGEDFGEITFGPRRTHSRRRPLSAEARALLSSMTDADQKQSPIGEEEQEKDEQTLREERRLARIKRGMWMLVTLNRHKVSEMLTQRVSMKDSSNRHWDHVLHMARKLVKPRTRLVRSGGSTNGSDPTTSMFGGAAATSTPQLRSAATYTQPYGPAYGDAVQQYQQKMRRPPPFIRPGFNGYLPITGTADMSNIEDQTRTYMPDRSKYSSGTTETSKRALVGVLRPQTAGGRLEPTPSAASTRPAPFSAGRPGAGGAGAGRPFSAPVTTAGKSGAATAVEGDELVRVQQLLAPYLGPAGAATSVGNEEGGLPEGQVHKRPPSASRSQKGTGRSSAVHFDTLKQEDRLRPWSATSTGSLMAHMTPTLPPTKPMTPSTWSATGFLPPASSGVIPLSSRQQAAINHNALVSRAQHRAAVVGALQHDRQVEMEQRIISDLKAAHPVEVPPDIHVGRLIGRHEPHSQSQQTQSQQPSSPVPSPSHPNLGSRPGSGATRKPQRPTSASSATSTATSATTSTTTSASTPLKGALKKT